MARFKSVDYYPPDGWYFYKDEHGEVRERSKLATIMAMRRLFTESGRKVPYDPMVLVMEYMCPFLPDGTCTEPSDVKVTTLAQVQDNTRRFFGKSVAPYDVIEKRLLQCQVCPKHDKSFCPGCTSYPQWINSGFRGKRKPLPVDEACGVCVVDQTMVSAAASVADPDSLGEEAPDGCWRKA